MEKQKVVPLVFETYLVLIKNSLGSDLFKNFYAEVDGVRKDILNNGEYSCAFFVSSILALLELIKKPRATVDSTVRELREAGWEEIQKPKAGAILVWENMDFGGGDIHKHIGFYVGDGKAISNDYKRGCPAEHHWTFGETDGKPNRKTELIFWNDKLK